MKQLTFLLLAMLACQLPTANCQLFTTNLRTEYKTNPLGIGETKPRLSWELISSARDVMQAAYQVRVAASESDLSKGKNLLWDSGKIASDQSNQVVYKGSPLASRQRCHWQIRVWDNKGNDSGWSKPAWWEMGLLAQTDWKAAWIEPGWDEDTTKSNPAPMLRKTFRLTGEVRQARVYATAQGLYEAEINGKKVGDQLFTPGWTSYNKRLQYQTYDVTSLLLPGDNAIGVTLGDGWYRGRLGWEEKRNNYGTKLVLLLQIEVTYKNGKTETFTSDATWRGSTGAILESDIYNGEVYDALQEKPGWSLPNYVDRNWKPVRIANLGGNLKLPPKLVAPMGELVRRIQELKPVKVFKTPKGETVVDFGQNMVGWVRLKLKGETGKTITLQHAEVLDKDGNFYTENMRSALTRIQYVMKGGEETYEPKFTFMGFRYVKVEGFPGEPKPENFTGIVVHSDLRKTGDFECSNALVNQLQLNIQWGQKGNFLDVPTDCPQRDERMGWTGDAQAFSRTANFNYDCAAFYTKWLADLAADQRPNGTVPVVIPDVLNPPGSPEAFVSAGWSDVAVIIPFNVYLAFGDKQVLENQYPSMKSWVEFMRQKAGDSFIYKNGSIFGDWLFYKTPISDASEPDGYTDRDYISTAFFAYSTHLLAQAARVLGKTEDATRYQKLFDLIKTAFLREYVTPGGRTASDSQTSYVLALTFDLLPEDLRPVAAGHLVADIKSHGNHLTTGFLGTPYLCEVLSKNGFDSMAYQLLLQETYPSWLYPVKMGATTIWERWDGIRPDSTFQDAGMNSFNHYAYGAIGDWLYRRVAGIEIDEEQPGYKHIFIQPQPGGGLTSAKAWLLSPLGKIESDWVIEGGKMRLRVVVPANATATVRLPKANLAQVTEGGKALAQGNGIRSFRQVGEVVEVEVGSGVFVFTQR